METVKRLTPKKDVLRDLYLKSGNRCAFPDCGKFLLDEDGDFLGEVCHIEAAMPGGERFNPNQTNEERRAFSNLMLLCYDHHTKTNDEEIYTVEILKNMKAQHEQKFSDIVGLLYQSTIRDLTQLQEYSYCKSLLRINNILDWNNTEDELLEVVPSFNELVDKLRDLDPDTRTVFTIMVQRSKGGIISLNKVKSVTGMDNQKFISFIAMLNEDNLITEPYEDDYGQPICEFVHFGYGDIWSDLKRFSEESGVSLNEIIKNMDFTYLD
ncbi:hypothetical protein [Priestia megaterium]